MTLSALTAISPIDGRYRNKVEALAAYFSEFALIQYRVRVEIEYLCLLAEVLPPVQALNKDHVKTALRRIYLDFSYDDARRVTRLLPNLILKTPNALKKSNGRQTMM